MHGMHAATSKVENSAQGSSCKLKFVHAYYESTRKGVYKIGLADQMIFYCVRPMMVKHFRFKLNFLTANKKTA